MGASLYSRFRHVFSSDSIVEFVECQKCCLLYPTASFIFRSMEYVDVAKYSYDYDVMVYW